MKKNNNDDKRYHSISEVSRMTGLEQYVLRYWEKEFPTLNPRKNRGGNRMYTTKDIDVINQINHLRKGEGLTITGARNKLAMKKGGEFVARQVDRSKAKTILGWLRKDVEDLLKLFP